MEGAAATAAAAAAEGSGAAGARQAPREAQLNPERECEGILLYYKYVPLAGMEAEVRAWYEELCGAQQQKGRIRVAADGVNVTVGGTNASLQAHIAAVKAHPVLRGADVDFKVAPYQGALSSGALRESGFEGLRVTVCKELVSLGAGARSAADPFASGGRHLRPREFHEALLRAADGRDGETVLIDARNAYETGIGRFDIKGVPLLDPRTRAFRELPAWLDANEARLAGKRVLMYCTGGVRCERASACLREKGAAFADVAQLSGGVQRYLEEFPDGGLFAGKLFVYDPRGSMSPEQGASRCVGSCIGCGAPHDDYGARARCGTCRQLVLLCGACEKGGAGAGAGGGGDCAGAAAAAAWECELCRERRGGAAAPAASPAAAAGAAGAAPRPAARGGAEGAADAGVGEAAGAGAGSSSREAAGRRKLRILCLHGFRQDAHQFRARSHELRKALEGVAELVFVDAPHLLPLWYRPREPQQRQQQQQQQKEQEEEEQQQQEQQELQQQQQQELQQQQQQEEEEERQEQQPKLPPRVRKRAWLLSPELLQLSDGWRAAEAAGEAREPQWEPAPDGTFEGSRLERQTEGWAGSLAALAAAAAAAAPLDAVLGYSQGAAVAAALCAMQQLARRGAGGGGGGGGGSGGESGGGGGTASGGGGGGESGGEGGGGSGCDLGRDWGLRFAVMISGFPSPCPEHQRLMNAAGPLRLPSLHIFGAAAAAAAPGGGCGDGGGGEHSGGGKGDRSIPPAMSEDLAALFDPASGRRLVRHGGGHDVPRTKALVSALREFAGAFAAAAPAAGAGR